MADLAVTAMGLSPQTMNVIETNHRTFLGNIELKISEVLVTKGDLVLVGDSRCLC